MKSGRSIAATACRSEVLQTSHQQRLRDSTLASGAGSRPRFRFKTVSLAIIALCFSLGCSSPEDRAEYHLTRGREFLADENPKPAKIEFRSALSFDRKNLAANLELADMAEREENRHDAIFYLREALAIDPKNNDIMLRLATLLRDDDPWRARQLLVTAVSRDPENAMAQLGLSQIELSIGRADEALRIAKRAIELDPSVPGAYWQLGIIYEFIIDKKAKHNEDVDESLRANGVEAFENFVERGGVPEWKARMEQARILATSLKKRKEALKAAKRALAAARLVEGDGPKTIAAKHLATLARAMRDRGAYADATEALLEVTQRDFKGWRNLAELREASGGSAEQVYQNLIAQFPNDAEAHNLYAVHIGNTKGVWSAIRYFEKMIEQGVDAPRMLSALRSYQLTLKLTERAAKTLEQMQAEYPEEPWTQLETAKDHAAAGLGRVAIQELEDLVARHSISEAFEALARLEQFNGRTRNAIRSAQSAVETKGYYEKRLYRLLADVLFHGGRHREHLDTLGGIEKYDDLDEEQRFAKARSLYAVQEPTLAREIMLELVESPTRKIEATIEFTRHEANDPKYRHVARRLLSNALSLHPNHPDLVTAEIDLFIQMGRQDLALAKLNELDLTRYPANVSFLRARLRVDHSDFDGAMPDIGHALRTDPYIPGLLDFAVLVYSKLNRTDRQLIEAQLWIKSVRAIRTDEWLTKSRKIAQFHLLRSRLLHTTGRNTQAMAVLEDAIANLEFAADSRIDLAYLLALTNTDVDRAIEIANEVVQKASGDPRALDALGFAYLTAEKPLDALEHFRLANRTVTSANALFLYHESMALRNLGREDEALGLIDEVLALDPAFTQARELRRTLMSQSSRPANPS